MIDNSSFSYFCMYTQYSCFLRRGVDEYSKFHASIEMLFKKGHLIEGTR